MKHLNFACTLILIFAFFMPSVSAETELTREKIKQDFSENKEMIVEWAGFGYLTVAPKGATTKNLVIEDVYQTTFYISPKIREAWTRSGDIQRLAMRRWVVTTSALGEPAVDIIVRESSEDPKGYEIVLVGSGVLSQWLEVTKAKIVANKLEVTGQLYTIDDYLAFMECRDPRTDQMLYFPAGDSAEKLINTGNPVSFEKLQTTFELAVTYSEKMSEEAEARGEFLQGGGYTNPSEFMDVGPFIPYSGPLPEATDSSAVNPVRYIFPLVSIGLIATIYFVNRKQKRV